MSAAIPGFQEIVQKFSRHCRAARDRIGQEGSPENFSDICDFWVFAHKRRAAVLDQAALDEIVRRHLCRVPFENVSKLLLLGREGAGRVTTLAEFLDGIEHRDLAAPAFLKFTSLMHGCVERLRAAHRPD